MIDPFLVYLETYTLPFIMVVLIYVLAVAASLPAFAMFCLFDNSHSKLRRYNGFDSDFPGQV